MLRIKVIQEGINCQVMSLSSGACSANFLWVISFHIQVSLLFFNKSLRQTATGICLQSKDFFPHTRLVHNTWFFLVFVTH